MTHPLFRSNDPMGVATASALARLSPGFDRPTQFAHPCVTRPGRDRAQYRLSICSPKARLLLHPALPLLRCRELTSLNLLSISPLTLGPSVRRSFDCATPRPAQLLFIATVPRRAARRGIKTNEAHLSTLQARPQAPARFPRAHGHQGWSRSGRRTPQSRPQAAVRLSGSVKPCRKPASPGALLHKGFANARSSWPSGMVKSAAGGFSCWK